MSMKKISEAILGVGVDDTTIDLFESQYPVPGGVSYNTYLIRDEKTAVMDTVDARATDAWMQALEQALGDQAPDYLVVSHVEPDHSANVARLAARGMRNREIAAQLHVSEETVKAHLKSIFQKLNIDRRSRLVELLK